MRAILGKGLQMREVKVKREDLLKKVKENRVTHIKEYREAVEGYKSAAIAELAKGMIQLKKQVDDLETGEMIRLSTVSFNLAVPQDHTKDYDQVIAMLEMSVDDTLTIRSDEFACFVMDDWDWKQDFLNTSMLYKKA